MTNTRAVGVAGPCKGSMEYWSLGDVAGTCTAVVFLFDSIYTSNMISNPNTCIRVRVEKTQITDHNRKLEIETVVR